MGRQELVEKFVEYMERERNRLGWTQEQMAKELEFSVSGYKKIVAGETTRIDVFMVYKLHEITGKWFFVQTKEEDTEFLQILEQLQELTPSQLRFISSVVDFEHQFLLEKSTENPEDYVSLLIPTGNLEDGMIWDSVNVEKFNIASYRKRFGDDISCALQITSNHICPVYNKGDILLISRTPPRDGDTGIFVNKEYGRAYIRQYKQTNPCALLPLTNFGEAFYVDIYDTKEISKWIKFGRVLAKIREKD